MIISLIARCTSGGTRSEVLKGFTAKMHRATGRTCVVGFMHGSCSSEASRRCSGFNIQVNLVVPNLTTPGTELVRLSPIYTSKKKNIYLLELARLEPMTLIILWSERF